MKFLVNTLILKMIKKITENIYINFTLYSFFIQYSNILFHFDYFAAFIICITFYDKTTLL